MKVIISLSGGIDSAVLAAHLLQEGHSVRCVSFSYGSKHNKYETAAARDICKHYKLSYLMLDLSSLFSSVNSSLLRNATPIPEGHYEDPEMKSTIVPGRNLIFSSVLASIAESSDSDVIALGVHQGDHAIYPDCRSRFIMYASLAIQVSTNYKIKLIAPFVNYNKSQIVKLGVKLNVPFSLTRTCYKDQPVACGKCGSCVERLEAFKQNGLDDLIAYEE